MSRKYARAYCYLRGGVYEQIRFHFTGGHVTHLYHVIARFQ